MKTGFHNRGFNLVELMIGLVLGSVVLVGLMQIFVSSRQSFDALMGQHSLQQNGQFALQFLSREIRQAGYTPRPWNQPALPAITPGSSDSGDAGDRLEIQYYSDRNCYGSGNPVAGADGKPEWYVKTVRFDLRAHARQLRWFCSYGPEGATPVVQVNNQTLVDDIDSFQVLYGEDSDGDKQPDRWINAGAWDDIRSIAMVNYGLLVNSRSAGDGSRTGSFSVLDHTLGPFSDTRNREVIQATVALRNYHL